MRSPELARDYVRRATVRLRAVDVLFDGESWADVVRESQEIVELALKGLLRSVGIDPPRGDLDELCAILRRLRRDRELAFNGAEDLTPSEFYKRQDGERARNDARRTVEAVSPHV